MELTKLYPAIAADHAAPQMTGRYKFISTKEVIDAMAAEGFEPHRPSLLYQPRGRTARDAFGRHVVEFRPTQSQEGALTLGDSVPRILFGNSHDGSTRAWVRAGLFRLVCSNGLVVSRMDLGQDAARHAGQKATELIQRAQQIARNTAPLYDKIRRWSNIELTRSDAHEFARLAATLRWNDPHRVDTSALLEVRRADDEGMDLWRVFNRVQEATTALQLDAVTRAGRPTRTQPLAEPHANTSFNEQLWELAEEFAEA